MSSSKYIQAAIRNIKDYVAKTHRGLKLAKRATGPFPTGYIAELDTTNEQQTHFKGVTLHLSARIIAWSPAPAEIE
jgi:hypothetical protein